MFYIFGIAKTEGKAEDVKIYSWFISTILTLSGLVCLFLGGKLLVDNAVVLARLAGLSEILIGLTIVAVGTSLPELATSVVAAYHHHDDIAIGNIVGSNIFNVFWVLGLTGSSMAPPGGMRIVVLADQPHLRFIAVARFDRADFNRCAITDARSVFRND